MMEDSSARLIEDALTRVGSPSRFAPHERGQLLSATGIGELVVQQLESAGVDSLARMRRLGVEGVLRLVQARHGAQALSNRRRALSRLIDAVQAHATPPIM